MDITNSLNGRNLIVKIEGDIDHHTSEEIREIIEKDYARHNAKNIIFDFSKVSFMDSSGIGMVIGRYKNIEKQGGKVAVCSAHGNIARIFNISGLHKIIDCFDDCQQAINHMGQEG